MRTLAAALLALALGGCGEGRARAGFDAGASVPAPPPSLPPSPVVELAVGWYSVVARLADGSVWYWGHWLDAEGQAQARPVRVPLSVAPAGITAAASQAYFCALGAKGAQCLTRLPEIYGEGWGDSWALDFGGSPPAQGSGGGLRQIAVENYHGCALLADGTVWCWGMNGRGELGNGETRTRSKPVRVAGLAEVEQIGAGHHHGCALRRDSTVWCWGSDDHGQLGGELDVTGGRSSGARPAAGVEGAVELAVGHASTCVRHRDGTVSCWGAGMAGQPASRRPRALAGVTDAVQLAAGGHAMCARRRDGRVLCWGHDQKSDVLGSAFERAPREVPGLDDARLISAGSFGGCAVRASGAVACWGSRRFGQLGDGETSGSADLSHVRW